MINLIEMLRVSLADDAGSAIATAVGAPDPETRSAIAAAIPVIVGAIAQRGATPMGADRVLGMLRSGSLERISPGAVATRLAVPSDLERILGQGSGVLGALFEDKVGALSESVAAISGLSGAIVPRVLGVVASSVLGVMKDHVVENRIGGRDFVELMNSQRSMLLGAIDRRLLGALGYSSVAAYLDPVDKSTSGRPLLTHPAPEGERPFMRRLIPWLLLVIAVLVLVLVVLRGRT